MNKMTDDNNIFTFVLRKDVFKMTRQLQEAFTCLVNLDRDLSQKKN